MQTLPLNDIVKVSVLVSPAAALRNGFNLGLIIGDSQVISAADRIKIFSGTDDLLTAGFTSNSAEYKAAQLYFSQSPKPSQVAIGRWDSAGESAVQAVQSCRQANTDWYDFTVCGVQDSDILGIAAYTETAQPNCVYKYTTASEEVLNGAPLTAGLETGGAAPATDISAGTETTFQIAVDGDVALSPVYHAVTLNPSGLNTGALIAAAMQAATRALGGIYSAVTVAFTEEVYVITSGTKGIGSKVRVSNGASNDLAAALKIGAANGAVDTDGAGSLMLTLQGLSYRRTLGQYSTQTPDAVAGILGYAMGANTGVANSAYTLAYKQEVGVTPEPLTANKAASIKSQNGNVLLSRGNTYRLFEQGVMADGTHFDEVIGLDMLANDIQLAVMDFLTGAPKVPQTEGGVTLLVTAITGPCDKAVNRGFIAPGVWNASPVLSLNTGDMLSKGYLVLSETIDSQSESDRSNRIAPPIYVCIKLAGAIENVVISVQVNQ